MEKKNHSVFLTTFYSRTINAIHLNILKFILFAASLRNKIVYTYLHRLFLGFLARSLTLIKEILSARFTDVLRVKFDESIAQLNYIIIF